MERLIGLEKQLVSGGNLEANELKRVVFGPNYGERDRAFELIKKMDILHHFHIT